MSDSIRLLIKSWINETKYLTQRVSYPIVFIVVLQSVLDIKFLHQNANYQDRH